MSRRRKESRERTASEPTVGTDLGRRVLLGAVAALIVARPLVTGEDPGRLLSPEPTSGLVLNLLWLIVAAVAAVWLARTPRGFRFGGPVTLGLVALVGLTLLSAAVVRCYRHAAWAVTWEWAVLPVVFVLVRELTTAPDGTDDSGGLLAVLLATATSTAAFGLYQAVAPTLHLPSPDLPSDAGSYLPPGSDFLNPIESLTEDLRTPWSTFRRPDTLLGFLLLLLPVCIAGALVGRRRLWVPAAVLAAVAAWAGWGAYRESQLLDGWTAATRMVADQPVLGVGPGNFPRRAPQVVPPSAAVVPGDPNGSWLELTATIGLAGGVALLVTLGWLFVRLARPRDTAGEAPPVDPGPRWEFHLGGVVGLLLGLWLRVSDLPGSESPRAILYAGAAAAGRALIWFLAYAAFEGAPLSRPVLRRALLIGLGLVAVLGVVSGGLLRPALAQPFWIAAALALGGTALTVSGKWDRLCRLAAVPLAAGLALGFGLQAVEPAVKCSRAVGQARSAARAYATKVLAVEKTPASVQPLAVETVRLYVAGPIRSPLLEALSAEPHNMAVAMELAGWYRAGWDMRPDPDWAKTALALPAGAAEFDPYNVQPVAGEIQVRIDFLRVEPAGRDRHLARIEELIGQATERDPSVEARLRYRLAQGLRNIKEDAKLNERKKAADEQAARALELDDQAPGPRWRLLPEQRQAVREWLKLPAE